MIGDLVCELFDNFFVNIKSKFGKWNSCAVHLCPKIYINDLDITNTQKNIVSIYNCYKVIQLRKLEKEKTLIVGCGNSPIFMNNIPIADKYRKQMMCSDNLAQFLCDHSHKNCYTVNPDMGMNPSVVAEFGINNLFFIGKNTFNTIIFEGFLMDVYKKNETYITDNVSTISTILYLLKDGGNVIFKVENCEKIKYTKISEALVHSHLNIVVYDDTPEQYYKFYSGMICKCDTQQADDSYK